MIKASTIKEKIVNTKKIEKILITLPKPISDRSPYFDLEKKYNIKIDFFPFIQVEGYSAKEFRKQKVKISNFSAVILVSRNAVDHFFRICEELKLKVSQDMKYFCATEAVALYLQKFILYRRRKVFFSPDGSSDGLIEILRKYRDRERFVFPVSENTKNDISPTLSNEGFNFEEAVLYKTVNNDISGVMKNEPDLIVFFSPFSIDCLFQYDKNFQQSSTLIGAFGPTTCQAIEDAGLVLSIKAPEPDTPSMAAAIDKYLEKMHF